MHEPRTELNHSLLPERGQVRYHYTTQFSNNRKKPFVNVSASVKQIKEEKQGRY